MFPPVESRIYFCKLKRLGLAKGIVRLMESYTEFHWGRSSASPFPDGMLPNLRVRWVMENEMGKGKRKEDRKS